MSAHVAPPGTWSNWTGSRAVTIADEFVPEDEAGVAQAIARTSGEGRQLRAVGTGYSWAEAVGEGAALLRTDRLRGVREIDLDEGTARLAAGTRLHEVCRELWQAGAELTTLGGFSGQTIAGAVSTATHGSGYADACLSASVRRLRLVDGQGRVVVIDEKQPNELRAARVALGMLGVVTEVEVSIRPARWLQVDDSWHPRYDPEWLSTDDGIRRAVRWHPTGEGAPPNMRFQLRTWRPASADAEGAIPSPEALASAGSARPPAFSVVEHAVPASRATEAVAALAAALGGPSAPMSGMPLSLRVVAADNAYLSPFNGERMVTVSAAAPTFTEGRALFELVHAVLLPYGARPHWAKEHLYAAEVLSDRYPDLAQFERVRQRFDPQGMFLTPNATYDAR